jgi:hypothetical protein
MAFARRPNAAETQAARDAQGLDPNNPLTDERGVVALRRDFYQATQMASRTLTRMRAIHDDVGAAALEAVLTTPEFNDFVADYNAFRTAVLQADPTADVPAAL